VELGSATLAVWSAPGVDGKLVAIIIVVDVTPPSTAIASAVLFASITIRNSHLSGPYLMYVERNLVS